MGLTVAKKYRRLNITTIPEMLERYYDTKGMTAGIFCQILVQLVIMSMQYVAGGTILSALMPEIFTPFTGMPIFNRTPDKMALTAEGAFEWASGSQV